MEAENNSTNEVWNAEPTDHKCRRMLWGWIAFMAVVTLLVGAGVGWMIGRNTARGSASSGSSEQAEAGQQLKDGTIKTFMLPGGVEMEMVYVEPGSFMMGSSENEEVREKDEAQHRVTLTEGYWIGKYPITQTQWNALVSAMAVSFDGRRPTAWFSKSGNGSGIVSGMDTSDFPMESISWDDCKALVEALGRNDREGRRWSLPTEAQWEFAARGGNKSCGYTYSGGDNLDAVGWYYENSGRRHVSDSDWKVESLGSNMCRTHPVKEKNIGNELGIVGMSGNVWEWCRDVYAEDFYDDCKAKGVVEDPFSDGAWGDSRVLRGGSWLNNARHCRSARRVKLGFDARDNAVGLRLCCLESARQNYRDLDRKSPQDYSNPKDFLNKYIIDRLKRDVSFKAFMQYLKISKIVLSNERISSANGQEVVCADLCLIPKSGVVYFEKPLLDSEYNPMMFGSSPDWATVKVRPKASVSEEFSIQVKVPRMKTSDGIYMPADQEGDNQYVKWGGIGRLVAADSNELTQFIDMFLLAPNSMPFMDMITLASFSEDDCQSLSLIKDKAVLSRLGKAVSDFSVQIGKDITQTEERFNKRAVVFEQQKRELAEAKELRSKFGVLLDHLQQRGIKW